MFQFGIFKKLFVLIIVSCFVFYFLETELKDLKVSKLTNTLNNEKVNTKKDFLASSSKSVSNRMSTAVNALDKSKRSGSIMVFDVDLITDSFKKCIENGLDLEQYNQGYNELYNFFNILGTVFGFIASDVREKIDILEKFRTDESSPSQKHYIKVEDMMLHEIKVDKEKKTELMGARTLLRLHRALDFTMQFLEKLNNLPVDGKVSTMAHEVYGKTLANFHPFFIRNAAKLAMYALPARSEFMKKVANPGVTDADINQAIKAGVEQMRAVYVAIEELYTKHDLHGLP